MKRRKQVKTQINATKPSNRALPKQAASINQLPSELLSVIFERYVWGLRRTPFALLLVSKFWYNLVNNTPSLWGNIFLGDPTLSRFCYGTIQCRTLDVFKAAIQKTKNATFQLTIDLGHIDFAQEDLTRCMGTLEPSWFKRCRALNLGEWGYSGDLLKSLSTFDFNGLQKLCIGASSNSQLHLLHERYVPNRYSRLLPATQSCCPDSLSSIFDLLSLRRSQASGNTSAKSKLSFVGRI
ncbi:hypothetical protein FRC16_003159 [Serendipita sp. 398]|nr:hypothetical protein FRC16_003159 [Serendipita sp. 398]